MFDTMLRSLLKSRAGRKRRLHSGRNRVLTIENLADRIVLDAAGAAELLAPGEPLPELISQPSEDVNGDGWLTPVDVVGVINRLNHSPAGASSSVGSCPSCDVNRDDFVTAVDALMLINSLNESGSRNLPPSLTAELAALAVSQGAVAVNQGVFRDPGSSQVELAASIGSVIEDESRPGVWEWTMPTDQAEIGSQAVTISATDDAGNMSQLEFEVVIEPAVLKLSPIEDQTIGRSNYLWLEVPLQSAANDALTFSASVYEAGGAEGTELPVTVEFVDQLGTYLRVSPNGFVGMLTIELTVSNGSASDTAQFSLESVQTVPALQPIADQLVQPEQHLEFYLPGRDQDGDRLEYSVQAYDPADSLRQPLPIDIEIDHDHWEDILWLSPNGYVGNIAVDLHASDGSASDTMSFIVESVHIIEPVADRRILQGELLTLDLATTHPRGETLTFSGEAYGHYAGWYPAEFNGNQMTLDFGDATGTFEVHLMATDGRNEFFESFVVSVKKDDPGNAAPRVFKYETFPKVWQDHSIELPFRATDDYMDEEWLSFSARVVPTTDGGPVPAVAFEFSEKETITPYQQFDRVLTVTPPPGYGGTFEVELSASDGRDTSIESYYVTVADQLKYSKQYGNDTYWLDTNGDIYGPGGQIILDREYAHEFDVNADGIYYTKRAPLTDSEVYNLRLRAGALPDSEGGDQTADFHLRSSVRWFALAEFEPVYMTLVATPSNHKFPETSERLYLLAGNGMGGEDFYRGTVSFSSAGEPSLQLTSISPGGSSTGDIQDFATDDSGSLYILNLGGDVRRFRDGQWQHVLVGVESFAVQKNGTIYYLCESGELRSWRNGLVGTVASSVRQFALDADETLYRLDTDGWFGSIDAKSSDPAATGDSGWDVLGQNIIFFRQEYDGTLSYFDGDPSDRYSYSFGNAGQSLNASYGDGTSGATFLFGDLSQFIAQARNEDAVGSQPPPVNGRSIIGGTLPSSYLDNQYGQSASKAILGAVARINTTVNGQQYVGSGTLLEWGGNRYILTAAHVVEDKNGNPVNRSQVTVDLPELGPGGAGLRVERILGRDFFRGLDSANAGAGLDLALLRLSTRVDSRIQGGILSENGAVPSRVLVAGYGTNNSGTNGSFNFGYTTLDGLGQRNSGNLETGHATTGLHIVNRWNGVEASFAGGDSGGPAFQVKRLSSSGSKPRWAPEIVAVHSFGKDPNNNGQFDIGEEKWSLQMTPAVAGRIKQVISAEVGVPQLIADFKVRVINDGDGALAGQGEWAMTLVVNGTAIANAHRVDVSEGPFHYPVASTTVAPDSTIQVQFYGYESDANELFTGGDDTIPLLSRSVKVPSERERSILADAKLEHSLGTRSGDTAYELLVSFRKAWA